MQLQFSMCASHFMSCVDTPGTHLFQRTSSPYRLFIHRFPIRSLYFSCALTSQHLFTICQHMPSSHTRHYSTPLSHTDFTHLVYPPRQHTTSSPINACKACRSTRDAHPQNLSTKPTHDAFPQSLPTKPTNKAYP